MMLPYSIGVMNVLVRAELCYCYKIYSDLMQSIVWSDGIKRPWPDAFPTTTSDSLALSMI